MQIIANKTNGVSYNTYKYSFDSIEIPSIDYDNETDKIIKWKERAETIKYTRSIDLKPLTENIKGTVPIIKYFLDGSRHVYKVADIAYNKQVFPVVAGQIGVGCCSRKEKHMYPETFYRELVLALPDKSNAVGWNDGAFFASKLKKLNDNEELRKLNLQFSAIISYSTSKSGMMEPKLEDRAIAVIQDYMIESEKKMVSKLVKKKLLGQNSYSLKDGSLEYKKIKTGKEDFRTLQKIRHNYS